MTKKNILQKKFEDFDILKGLLSVYPNDYRGTVIDKMEEVTDEIINYLDDVKRDFQEFTLAEVAKYNGKDGMPSYVVISGTVYDASDVSVWNNGIHFGLSAGADLTKNFENCHSNEAKILGKLRPVGTLKE